MVWHLKQTGKVKKLNKWMAHKLIKQQQHCFEMSSSLILHKYNEPFLDWMVTCGEKWILYDNWWQPAQWLDQEIPKHFPKPGLYQNRSWLVWWSVACLIHYTFLHLSKTITSEKYAQQTDEMHQTLQCLQPAFVNRKGPVLLQGNV